MADERNLFRGDVSEASSAIASPLLHDDQQSHIAQHMGSPGLHEASAAESTPQPVIPSIVQHDVTETDAENARGLRITARPLSLGHLGTRSIYTPPTPSNAVASSSRTSPQTPESTNPLISPALPRLDSESSIYGYGSGFDSPDEFRTSRGKNSLFTEGMGTFPEEDESTTRPTTINDNYDEVVAGCKSKHDIHTGRLSWLSISSLLLSIYSTIFSGIYLGIAIAQPRYGRTIRTGGDLSPSTASIVFALFAKTIELSFVTVFVTFLGQVLSRRALVKSSRGITIPELTMRTWVIQPGFMITHGNHLSHAGLTVTGMIALTAALAAMFYTTASDALVSPHLKYGGWEMREMRGLVETCYANSTFILNNCQTPVTTSLDLNYSGSTCLAIEHAGQAYHNYATYLDVWTANNDAGIVASPDLYNRPQAVGLLYDNTTVTGSWIETNTSNITSSWEQYGRIINNVTMAMPHAGVSAASRSSINNIMQPADLEGLGEYSVKASVVSPAINVLCADLTPNELAPLIYTTWPNATLINPISPGQKMAWPHYDGDIKLEPGQDYLNSTAYPIDFNSITNVSVLNSDSIYLLIKSAATTNYTICQMRSFLSPSCSTQFNVSGMARGTLQSHCEDPEDTMAYSKSVLDAPISRNKDYAAVISQWALALSLNTGITNANASIARLLSQLVPTMPHSAAIQLSSNLPSIGEALATLAGCTLLLSTTTSTFYHFWNYTETQIPGSFLPFNASLARQEYTSGATQKWQYIFYIILVVVFVTNMICFVYFIVRAGLVTDYTQPQNLFTLSVNSPPSEKLHGSCGAGPEGEQLNVAWQIGIQEGFGGAEHFYIKEAELQPAGHVHHDNGTELRHRAPRKVKRDFPPPGRFYARTANPKAGIVHVYVQSPPPRTAATGHLRDETNELALYMAMVMPEQWDGGIFWGDVEIYRCFIVLAFIIVATIIYTSSRGAQSWYPDFHLPTTAESSTSPSTKSPEIRLLIPSFEGHFPELLHFLKSLTCLCTDISDIPISIILSNPYEVALFNSHLASEASCGATFQNYNTSAASLLRQPPRLELVNLYDILPPEIKNLTSEDTTDLLEIWENGKYNYQAIKKLAAAAYFDYEYAFWLDSEGVAVRPFAFKDIVDRYLENPVIWRSTMTERRGGQGMQDVMAAGLSVLGRKIEDFGKEYWNLESFFWIIEKAIISDLISVPSFTDPGTDFWARLISNPMPKFEISIYNFHIHSMKEESTLERYAKYRILDSERELTKAGLAHAIHQIWDWVSDTGLLERLYLLLREDGCTELVAEFVRKNNLFFQRIDDKIFLEREVAMKFLREAPVALIVSSDPKIDEWVAEDQLRGNGTWSMGI
ncbi:hypothetical protein B7494_g4637 [Chlorociboria aeruginascens]|nr:hypothetical protein B7494_g4637 [Chlorociboria aeruginascens]